jgi:outer membrane protein OmpA-like peptidoglycan-associated protein/tetratricopeptide (TPR) repeat protein
MKCRKSSILLAMAIAISGAVCAQSAATKMAERDLKRFDFADAADNYKTAVARAPKDISLKEKLARTYVLMDDHADAADVYSQIVKVPASQAINKLYYGLELRALGKYDEAAKAFSDYAQQVPADPRGQELSGSAGKMKTLAIDTKVYEITDLKDINSDASDMGVAFYKDGILFSSNRGTDHSVLRTDMWTGRRFYDLYTVSGQGGHLGAPAKLAGRQPDRRFHEGPAVVSADGKELFFTRSNYKRNRATRSADGTVKLKIMHADWSDAKGQWINIKEISLDNDAYSIGHPALSKDGKRLYFMSDMPGGLGETDIYVSYRDMSGNWGTAINLGKGVNTAGREMFPFIADDGTLYFASDSRFGLGGLDVYAATLTNGEWGDAENVGAPINSAADDFGYIIDAQNTGGYFVSNRAGGNGDDDIYRFTKSGLRLCGTVADAITHAPLHGAEVKLTDENNMVTTVQAGDSGNFCFPILPHKKYKVAAGAKDYDAGLVSVNTGNSNQVVQIPLSKTGAIDLSVCVRQLGTGAVMTGATVELANKVNGVKKTCVVAAGCNCKFDLDPNTDYDLCATMKSDNAKGSYDYPCKSVTTKGKAAPASLYENLELTYLEENMVIKIDNLYYDVNKWNIRPDAAKELDKIVALMQKFPNMQIELASHTDCRGSASGNLELSQRRAKACVDYLVSRGIPAMRMRAVGYGKRFPVNSCNCEGKSTCTEEQYQENRRTEFKILKLK